METGLVMKIEVFGSNGSATGRSVVLDPSVFGIEPNDHIIWLDVRRIQARARQGTHKTKGRSEVRGSTRKLYRQKGTGYARAGSRKSPLRRTGGTFFGPRPRTYGFKVNVKASRLARRSALSYKAKREACRVVDDLQYAEPSSRKLVELVAALDVAGSKVLVLTGTHQPGLYRSSTNLPKIRVKEAKLASTLDILAADVVVFEESAVALLTDVLSGQGSSGPDGRESSSGPGEQQPSDA